MVAKAARWRRLNFPCHASPDAMVEGRCETISAAKAAEVDDPAPSDLGRAAELLREGGVAKIVLIHGTFAGNDIVGLVRQVARFSPSLAGKLSLLGKRWFDEFAGEVGNYTASYAQLLSRLINTPSLPPIEVTRFGWSGENHHLGRAGAVMSLINSQGSNSLGPNERVLALAHSHGGNVLAMLSHLIGCDQQDRAAFFDATRLHYRNPLTGAIDLPNWDIVSKRLAEAREPRIDVATFGTPLRYRWNTSVCSKLLHFVHHRPLDPQHPAQAVLPTSIQQVIDAEGGDYVQQLGIAGTDFVTFGFAWREWIVERRMRRMFERGARRRDLIGNLKRGQRISADGTTLLVDYPDSDQQWRRKLFGHGVYTCHQWLPFHLREIAERFYGQPGSQNG